MPASQPVLALKDARRSIERRSLIAESPVTVGVELEWLTVVDGDPEARVDPVVAAAPHGRVLPAGSRLTFEPGGQLEISAPPSATIDGAIASAAADLATVAAGAAAAGFRLLGLGVDPHRSPERVVRTPRYDAMETYFDAQGGAGRQMMCNTAAVQVNVGVNAGERGRQQWHLAHRLAPTLAAIFANSPVTPNGPSGFRSSRLAAWAAIDRSRTAPLAASHDPARTWADYVVQAQVMLIRPPGAQRFEPVLQPLTFQSWIEHGHSAGFPTEEDLDYHLSTLFPPVRPRGWLEMRMIDALPDPWWRVPVALIAAVLWDDAAREAASAACRPVERHWQEAYRFGLAHSGLAASARAVFDAAGRALERLGVDSELRAVVAAFAARYVDRGRSPADDRIDEWVTGHDATNALAVPVPPRERVRS